MFLRSLLLIFLMILTGTSAYAQEILKGYTSAEQLSENSRLYSVYVNRYEPDPAVIDSLHSVNVEVRILIYMGTWCKESKRYIPELTKTLEQADNPLITPEYIAVGYPREDLTGTMSSFGVTKIPTVIVLKNDAEAGRIEEKPVLSMEQDLWKIIAGDPPER